MRVLASLSSTVLRRCLALTLGVLLTVSVGVLSGPVHAQSDTYYEVPLVIPVPGGVFYGWAFGINDDGVIVGYLRLSDDKWIPVFWINPYSDPIPLALPAGSDRAIATGINNNGHITGGGFFDGAACYSSGLDNPSLPPELLPRGTFLFAGVRALNGAHNAVGTGLSPQGTLVPVFWMDKHADPIGLQMATQVGANCAMDICIASGINDHQEIVGFWCANGQCGNFHSPGPGGLGVPLPNDGGINAAGIRLKAAVPNLAATAINNAGQIVGASMTNAGGTSGIPYIWLTRTATGAMPLPLGNLSWAVPWGINNLGVVSGVGFDPVANRNVPVIWQPVPNYQGLWWKFPAGSESGWGVNVNHEGDTIFITWFTFDVDGNPWWLVMAAKETAPGSHVFTGDLYTGTGPPFSSVPFDPTAVNAEKVGTATLTFTDENNGSFEYTVNGVHQTKEITKQVFGSPVPMCIWGAEPNLALVAHHQAIWWAKPAGSESGWGINLTQQGNVIFASWFTFGPDGKPWWLVIAATETAPGSNVYTGDFYTGTGPAFNADPFDPAQVVPVKVGTGTFTFTDGNTATFDYTVNDVTQSKTITRQVLGTVGTMCQQ